MRQTSRISDAEDRDGQRPGVAAGTGTGGDSSSIRSYGRQQQHGGSITTSLRQRAGNHRASSSQNTSLAPSGAGARRRSAGEDSYRGARRTPPSITKGGNISAGSSSGVGTGNYKNNVSGNSGVSSTSSVISRGSTHPVDARGAFDIASPSSARPSQRIGYNANPTLWPRMEDLNSHESTPDDYHASSGFFMSTQQGGDESPTARRQAGLSETSWSEASWHINTTLPFTPMGASNVMSGSTVHQHQGGDHQNLIAKRTFPMPSHQSIDRSQFPPSLKRTGSLESSTLEKAKRPSPDPFAAIQAMRAIATETKLRSLDALEAGGRASVPARPIPMPNRVAAATTGSRPSGTPEDNVTIQNVDRPPFIEIMEWNSTPPLVVRELGYESREAVSWTIGTGSNGGVGASMTEDEQCYADAQSAFSRDTSPSVARSGLTSGGQAHTAQDEHSEGWSGVEFAASSITFSKADGLRSSVLPVPAGGATGLSCRREVTPKSSKTNSSPGGPRSSGVSSVGVSSMPGGLEHVELYDPESEGWNPLPDIEVTIEAKSVPLLTVSTQGGDRESSLTGREGREEYNENNKEEKEALPNGKEKGEDLVFTGISSASKSSVDNRNVTMKSVLQTLRSQEFTEPGHIASDEGDSDSDGSDIHSPWAMPAVSVSNKDGTPLTAPPHVAVCSGGEVGKEDRGEDNSGPLLAGKGDGEDQAMVRSVSFNLVTHEHTSGEAVGGVPENLDERESRSLRETTDEDCEDGEPRAGVSPGELAVSGAIAEGEDGGPVILQAGTAEFKERRELTSEVTTQATRTSPTTLQNQNVTGSTTILAPPENRIFATVSTTPTEDHTRKISRSPSDRMRLAASPSPPPLDRVDEEVLSASAANESRELSDARNLATDSKQSRPLQSQPLTDQVTGRSDSSESPPVRRSLGLHSARPSLRASVRGQASGNVGAATYGFLSKKRSKDGVSGGTSLQRFAGDNRGSSASAVSSSDGYVKGRDTLSMEPEVSVVPTSSDPAPLTDPLTRSGEKGARNTPPSARRPSPVESAHGDAAAARAVRLKKSLFDTNFASSTQGGVHSGATRVTTMGFQGSAHHGSMTGNQNHAFPRSNAHMSRSALADALDLNLPATHGAENAASVFTEVIGDLSSRPGALEAFLEAGDAAFREFLEMKDRGSTHVDHSRDETAGTPSIRENNSPSDQLAASSNTSPGANDVLDVRSSLDAGAKEETGEESAKLLKESNMKLGGRAPPPQLQTPLMSSAGAAFDFPTRELWPPTTTAYSQRGPQMTPLEQVLTPVDLEDAGGSGPVGALPPVQSVSPQRHTYHGGAPSTHTKTGSNISISTIRPGLERAATDYTLSTRDAKSSSPTEVHGVVASMLPTANTKQTHRLTVGHQSSSVSSSPQKGPRRDPLGGDTERVGSLMAAARLRGSVGGRTTTYGRHASPFSANATSLGTGPGHSINAPTLSSNRGKLLPHASSTDGRISTSARSGVGAGPAGRSVSPTSASDGARIGGKGTATPPSKSPIGGNTMSTMSDAGHARRSRTADEEETAVRRKSISGPSDIEVSMREEPQEQDERTVSDSEHPYPRGLTASPLPGGRKGSTVGSLAGRGSERSPDRSVDRLSAGSAKTQEATASSSRQSGRRSSGRRSGGRSSPSVSVDDRFRLALGALGSADALDEDEGESNDEGQNSPSSGRPSQKNGPFVLGDDVQVGGETTTIQVGGAVRPAIPRVLIPGLAPLGEAISGLSIPIGTPADGTGNSVSGSPATLALGPSPFSPSVESLQGRMAASSSEAQNLIGHSPSSQVSGTRTYSPTGQDPSSLGESRTSGGSDVGGMLLPTLTNGSSPSLPVATASLPDVKFAPSIGKVEEQGGNDNEKVDPKGDDTPQKASASPPLDSNKGGNATSMPEVSPGRAAPHRPTISTSNLVITKVSMSDRRSASFNAGDYNLVPVGEAIGGFVPFRFETTSSAGSRGSHDDDNSLSRREKDLNTGGVLSGSAHTSAMDTKGDAGRGEARGVGQIGGQPVERASSARAVKLPHGGSPWGAALGGTTGLHSVGAAGNKMAAVSRSMAAPVSTFFSLLRGQRAHGPPGTIASHSNVVESHSNAVEAHTYEHALGSHESGSYKRENDVRRSSGTGLELAHGVQRDESFERKIEKDTASLENSVGIANNGKRTSAVGLGHVLHSSGSGSLGQFAGSPASPGARDGAGRRAKRVPVGALAALSDHAIGKDDLSGQRTGLRPSFRGGSGDNFIVDGRRKSTAQTPSDDIPSARDVNLNIVHIESPPESPDDDPLDSGSYSIRDRIDGTSRTSPMGGRRPMPVVATSQVGDTSLTRWGLARPSRFPDAPSFGLLKYPNIEGLAQWVFLPRNFIVLYDGLTFVLFLALVVARGRTFVSLMFFIVGVANLFALSLAARSLVKAGLRNKKDSPRWDTATPRGPLRMRITRNKDKSQRENDDKSGSSWCCGLFGVGKSGNSKKRRNSLDSDDISVKGDSTKLEADDLGAWSMLEHVDSGGEIEIAVRAAAPKQVTKGIQDRLRGIFLSIPLFLAILFVAYIYTGTLLPSATALAARADAKEDIVLLGSYDGGIRITVDFYLQILHFLVFVWISATTVSATFGMMFLFVLTRIQHTNCEVYRELWKYCLFRVTHATVETTKDGTSGDTMEPTHREDVEEAFTRITSFEDFLLSNMEKINARVCRFHTKVFVSLCGSSITTGVLTFIYLRDVQIFGTDQGYLFTVGRTVQDTTVLILFQLLIGQLLWLFHFLKMQAHLTSYFRSAVLYGIRDFELTRLSLFLFEDPDVLGTHLKTVPIGFTLGNWRVTEGLVWIALTTIFGGFVVEIIVVYSTQS